MPWPWASGRHHFTEVQRVVERTSSQRQGKRNRLGQHPTFALDDVVIHFGVFEQSEYLASRRVTVLARRRARFALG